VVDKLLWGLNGGDILCNEYNTAMLYQRYYKQLWTQSNSGVKDASTPFIRKSDIRGLKEPTPSEKKN
jgi:hypothetical protein